MPSATLNRTATRNIMDIAVIPVLKRLMHLPVIGDPLHGTGRRDYVIAMAHTHTVLDWNPSRSCSNRWRANVEIDPSSKVIEQMAAINSVVRCTS
jgi:hypothetical protein